MTGVPVEFGFSVFEDFHAIPLAAFAKPRPARTRAAALNS